MAYIRVASGYRPGGPNFNCGILPGLPCAFDADTTQNYEFGVKGAVFENALSFDASVYYIDWKDIQIGGLLFAPNVSYTGNASRAKSQGFELAVESQPLDGLSLAAWIAYNEAELSESFPPATVVGMPGDRLPFSPRVSGSLSIDQEFELGALVGATGFLGGTVAYVGERRGNFSPASAVRSTFPGYAQVDLRTGATYDTWTLNLFVNNAADKRGVLRGGRDGLEPGLVNYIQPRTIGLSLSKDF